MKEDFSISFSLSEVSEIEQFVSRKKELDKIKDSFQDDESQRRIVRLHELGEIGKTQLTMTFVKEHRDTYSVIFWLNDKNEDTLKQSFAGMIKRLHDEYSSLMLLRTTMKKKNLDRVIAVIKQWFSLRENTRWMLIFDNIDNLKLSDIENSQAYDIELYFSEVHQEFILIITRSSHLKIDKIVLVKKLVNI